MPANRSLGAVSLGNTVLRCTRGREAKPNGIKPAGGAGFAYMQGPDGAIVEYLGNMPADSGGYACQQ